MRSHRTYAIYAGLIVLIALFFRLYRIETVPLDYDHSYALGSGIQLLDALREGTFNDVALHGQPSSLRWPNPVLANYILAAIGAIDRSPTFAFIVIAMSGVISTALTMAIVNVLFGKTAALFAGLAAATSPWLVFYARGTSQLGMFELAEVVPACILWWAISRGKRRLSILAVWIGAFTAHIYIVGFGLMAQMGTSIAQIAIRRRKWRVIAAAGLLAFSLSLGVYALVLLKADPQFFSNPHIRLNYGEGTTRSGTDHRWMINPYGILRSFDLISGGGFPEMATARNITLDATGMTLRTPRIALISLAMALGMVVIATTRSRHSRFVNASILLWYLIPVFIITTITSVSRNTPVSYYYLILAAPTQAVFTGVGISWILKWIQTHKPLWALACLAISLVLIVPSIVAQHHLADAFWAGTAPEGAYDLALGELQPLHPVWESQCTELTVPYHPFAQPYELEYWAYSWTGDTTRVAPQTEVNLGATQTWAGSGRRCALRLSNQPSPPDAQVIARTEHASLYQPIQHASDEPGVPTSIGWELDGTDIPTQLKPSQTVTLTFRWHIASIPDGSYSNWRYDVFVKLLDTGNNVIAQSEALSIPGSSWRQGMDVVQTTTLSVPENANGAGSFVISLYDRTKGEIAFFKPNGTNVGMLVFPVKSGS